MYELKIINLLYISKLEAFLMIIGSCAILSDFLVSTHAPVVQTRQ